MEKPQKKTKTGENQIEFEIAQRKCTYFDKGFCKEGGNCRKYHPTQVCEDHKSKGYCVKINCRDRHPKTCYYWQTAICYIGNSCRYNHSKISNPEIYAIETLDDDKNLIHDHQENEQKDDQTKYEMPNLKVSVDDILDDEEKIHEDDDGTRSLGHDVKMTNNEAWWFPM